MTGIIICNGSMRDYAYAYNKYFSESSESGDGSSTHLTLCADGGADHARKLGIRPDIIIGDLDSISRENLEYYGNLNVEIITYPTQKNATDTELAIDLAIEKGCRKIIILAGLGQRIDHSLSNIFILYRMLEKGVRGVVVDEYNEISIIKDKIELKKEENSKLSLIPLTQKVEGISTKGLYYSLKNAEMNLGTTQGVSNEFISDVAEVTIKKGILLVIKSRDK